MKNSKIPSPSTPPAKKQQNKKPGHAPGGPSTAPAVGASPSDPGTLLQFIQVNLANADPDEVLPTFDGKTGKSEWLRLERFHETAIANARRAVGC